MNFFSIFFTKKFAKKKIPKTVKHTHQKQLLLIQLQFQHLKVKVAHVVVVPSLPLNQFQPRAENGIANASSAKIVKRHLTQSLHAMVPIRMFIAEHAMERYRGNLIELFFQNIFGYCYGCFLRNGVHMDMDLLAVLDFCKLMEQRKFCECCCFNLTELAFGKKNKYSNLKKKINYKKFSNLKIFSIFQRGRPFSRSSICHHRHNSH